MNTQARVALSTGFAVSYAKLALVVLVGLLIASSWLVFPYFVQGKQLLRGVGDNARLTKAGSVSRYFTRELVNHPELALQATFATNEFFQFVDRANIVANLRPDKYFIFFVSENIHEGVLAYELPDVELYVGDTKYSPQASIGPNIAEHHRITVYSFPKRDAEGHRIDIDSVANIRLHVANYYMGSERKLTFIGLWKAPYELPDDLKYSTDITVVAMLALGAGLLSSVLTPCLLQLVVMYGSVDQRVCNRSRYAEWSEGGRSTSDPAQGGTHRAGIRVGVYAVICPCRRINRRARTPGSAGVCAVQPDDRRSFRRCRHPARSVGGRSWQPADRLHTTGPATHAVHGLA